MERRHPKGVLPRLPADRDTRPVKIALTIRFNIDDPTTSTVRRFCKKVEAELPHVPRIGEGLTLPGKDFTQYLGARRVEDVIYTLEGQVILDFKLDGFFNSVEDQVRMLVEAGYYEVGGSAS